MNKFVLVSISFVLGAAAGFAAGYFLTIEDDEATRVYGNDIKPEPKHEEKTIVQSPAPVAPVETETPTENNAPDPSKIVSTGIAKIPTPEHPGVDYSKVAQIVKENGYTSVEDIQSVINDPDNEITYEEMLEKQRVKNDHIKNKDKILPITAEEWEVDYPTEDDYPRGDLHYFVEDDLFTDDDGNPINEEEYIGTRPRQFGWMANNEDKIYIRNNPKETDFVVWKHRCTAEDWWGEE